MPAHSDKNPPWSQFDVFWWNTGVFRYKTSGPQDIRFFSSKRIGIKVHPRTHDDDEDSLEIILQATGKDWQFHWDDSDEFDVYFAEDDWYSIWTYAEDDQVIVIRGTKA